MKISVNILLCQDEHLPYKEERISMDLKNIMTALNQSMGYDNAANIPWNFIKITPLL